LGKAQDAGSGGSGGSGTETSPGGSLKRVNFRSPSNSQTDLSDSWSVLNAKLQYEKHMQEQCLAGEKAAAHTHTTQSQSQDAKGNNDVQQRREFYQSGGQGQNGGKRVAGAGAVAGGNIEDIQTNFGEIMHSAPAAWSPQFTRKQYKVGNTFAKKSSFEEHSSSSVPGASSGSGSVFTKGAMSAEMGGDSSAKSDPMSMCVGMGMDADEGVGEEGEAGKIQIQVKENKEQFMNKRAGHYNEFKVLQAMRAKMAEEDEEDEDGSPYEDTVGGDTGGAGADPDAESSQT
jgi:hypothetical protein